MLPVDVFYPSPKPKPQTLRLLKNEPSPPDPPLPPSLRSGWLTIKALRFRELATQYQIADLLVAPYGDKHAAHRKRDSILAELQDLLASPSALPADEGGLS